MLSRGRGVGYIYLAHVVEDHSRVAYFETLGDERRGTAAGVWTRAWAFGFQSDAGDDR
ncbi:integrase [Corynebacterium humireducens NBRC 106098 = DSM 45392]|uniref:Integrase n=1 Tax=Corynebacterium humireducens NBRC 106098 = DSM 45392 TaxID=1223515 RepID=A0A0B5D9N8_9CORY|nr:integrase [Corynebacterium humireducens NBRC 106098 = DSM 45392]